MKAYPNSSTMHTIHVPTLARIENLIACIRDTNELLQVEVDLSPTNQLVTSMINHLSHHLRSSYSLEEVQYVLSNTYIRINQLQLQAKLSEVEFLAELQDASDLCKLDSPVLNALMKLPTWSIYKALVSQELSMLRQLIRYNSHLAKQPIVFVGSGPMPLSAIILHLLGNVKVICLEKDARAYEASCLLLERLGLTEKVTVVLANGTSFDYSSCGVIFVASLVQSKIEVLEQINRTSSSPLVAVRTAEGMRQIRYEAINESQLNKQGWRIMDRTYRKENLVINSTLFLRNQSEFM